MPWIYPAAGTAWEGSAKREAPSSRSREYAKVRPCARCVNYGFPPPASRYIPFADGATATTAPTIHAF